MPEKISAFLTRLLLFISGAAFLALCVSRIEMGIVYYVYDILVLLLGLIVLPITFDSIKCYFKLKYLVAFTLIEYGSWRIFYDIWSKASFFIAFARKLGISSNRLLLLLCVPAAVVSTPFLVCVGGWVIVAVIYDNGKLVRLFSNKKILCCICGLLCAGVLGSILMPDTGLKESLRHILPDALMNSQLLPDMTIRAVCRHILSGQLLLAGIYAAIYMFIKCKYLPAENKETIFTEKQKTILIIVAAALSASMPMLYCGLDYGHDTLFHITRIESIAQTLLGGQFPARMESFVYNDYGYPMSIYYGDVLLYIPVLLRIAGFSVEVAYKVYVLLINFATVIVSYLCFSKMFSRQAALLASTAYMLANYRLVDIYVRAAVGEYTAMLFFPMILLALWYIYTTEGKKNEYAKAVILLSVSMAGLIFTHLLSTEMAVVAVAIIALAECRKTFTKKRLLTYIRAVMLTLVLSAGWWIPFIDYYLNVDTEIKSIAGEPILLQGGATHISEYLSFFRPVRGWATSNAKEHIQLTPGIVLIGALGLALWVLLVKREKNIRLTKLTIYSFIFLILASNIFPWDWWATSNPIGRMMSQAQFAWRYVSLSCIALAALLGYVYDNVACIRDKRRVIAQMAFACCVIICIRFTGDYRFGTASTKLEPSTTIVDNLYTLKGTSSDDLQHIVIVSNGVGELVKEQGINKDVYVEASDNASVTFPVFCYPNYVVTDENGRSYDITEGRNRTIKIQLDTAYSGMLYLRYKEPWYWRAAELISLCGAAYMAYYLVRAKKHCGG